MKIYLIRHAHAVKGDEDGVRPLSEESHANDSPPFYALPKSLAAYG